MWSVVVTSCRVFVYTLFLTLVGCDVMFYEETKATQEKIVIEHICNGVNGENDGSKNTTLCNNTSANLGDNSSNMTSKSLNNITYLSHKNSHSYLNIVHTNTCNYSSRTLNNTVSDNKINASINCTTPDISNPLYQNQGNHNHSTSNATFYYDTNAYNSNFLVEDGGIWFVCKRYVPGLMDKIVENGDGRGGKNMIYARGEAGVWYKFYKPPNMFIEYLIQLPACFDSFIQNGTDWYVLNRKGKYTKVVKRGSRKKQDTLYLMANDGIWYRARKSNMSNQFTFDVAQLPIASDIKKYNPRDKSYEKELFKEGGEWYVKQGDQKDKLVERGSPRRWRFLCYYRGESGKWYKFLDPPRECISDMEKYSVRPEVAGKSAGDMFNFK